MKEEIVYLDSSAVIKRYIKEPGSTYIRNLYREIYSGEKKIAYSIWNLGEVLGVFDRARRIGRIGDEDYKLVRTRFIHETNRTFKLGILHIIPVNVNILTSSWKLIEKYGIYQADAIQITSAKESKATLFVTGDKRLFNIASEEGLESKYLG